MSSGDGATLRFVAAHETIKSIGVSPPVGNFEAASYGLPSARVSALHGVGFNCLRMWVSQSELMASDENIPKWVGYISEGVSRGFKVNVCFAAEHSERVDLLVDPVKTARFREVLTSFAEALMADFEPEDVALELMNEPPGDGDLPEEPWHGHFAPLFWRAARQGGPDLTIVVSSGSAGWFEDIPKLDPKQFDGNTMYAFHPYQPGEFTHQGIGYPGLYRIPYPAVPGGSAALKTQVNGQVDALVGFTDEQKASMKSGYTSIIDNAFYWSGAPLGTAPAWAQIDSWVAAYGLDPKQVFANEFGVVGDINFAGVLACDLESRANYYRTIRETVETKGYGGWSAHQAMGDFNLFQQTDVNTHGNELIPEMVTALFG